MSLTRMFNPMHEIRRAVRQLNGQWQETVEAIARPLREWARQREEVARQQRRQEARERLERLSGETAPPDVKLHPKTVEWAEHAYPCLDGKSRIKDLMRATAAAAGTSVKTPEKWLQDRNPLYEPGRGDNLDKFRRMRRAVLMIVAYFTETP